MKKVLLAVLAMVMFSSLALAQGPAPAKPPEMTKEQIVQRGMEIDKQLLLIERQELVYKYQAIEAKEKADALKVEADKKAKEVKK